MRALKGDPLALAPAVHAAVRSVDRELVLTDVTSVTDEACYLPARRAARMDPAAARRRE